MPPGRARHARLDLESFERFHGRAGRLRRYAAGRVRAFPLRVLAATMGCLALALFGVPWIALLAAIATFPAEAAEQLILRRLLARDRFDDPSVSRLVSVASAVQALGLAVPIVLAGVQGASMRMFAGAFVLGAVSNAMIAASFHRPSFLLRTGIVSGAGLFILLHALQTGALAPMEFAIELTAFAMVGAMLAQLFSHLQRREARMVAAERELIAEAEHARRLALVAEHAKDSVMLLDPQRRITWVNPYFTEMTGYTPGEALGRTPGELLDHPQTDPSEVEKLLAVAREARPATALLLNRRKDGSTFWAEVHQSPVLGPDGSVELIISVERDATERVAARERLRAALLKARAADLEKVEFLSRMSHELRTPANGLMGGIELLRAGPLTEGQREVLAMLHGSAARLVGLLEDVLDFSELKGGRVRPRARPFRPVAMLDSLIEERMGMAAEKGLRLERAPGAEELWVEADEHLLRRLVDKLLVNAIAFTSRGHVRLLAEHEAGTLAIRVQDTGKGIAEEDRARIFDVFQQADTTRTRRVDGAGLGLSIARDIARVMDGELALERTGPEGSTFRVTIPAPLAEAPADARPVAARRALVAEDNRANRLLISRMLEQTGLDVEFAEDGEEAVSKFRAAAPDVVLMDVSMPGKDGIEATREIREIERREGRHRCPIVAVTANAGEADRRRCLDSGMDAFLPKPIRKARLVQTLQQVLAERAGDVEKAS